MNLPPPDDWLTFAEAAEKLGVSYKHIYNSAIVGRKRAKRPRTYLACWMTPKGYVTTLRSLRQFIDQLQ